LSGRGLCDELITRPEESYRLCCVVVCDLEISRMGAPYIYDISRLRVKTVQLCISWWKNFDKKKKTLIICTKFAFKTKKVKSSGNETGWCESLITFKERVFLLRLL